MDITKPKYIIVLHETCFSCSVKTYRWEYPPHPHSGCVKTKEKHSITRHGEDQSLWDHKALCLAKSPRYLAHTSRHMKLTDPPPAPLKRMIHLSHAHTPCHMTRSLWRESRVHVRATTAPCRSQFSVTVFFFYNNFKKSCTMVTKAKKKKEVRYFKWELLQRVKKLIPPTAQLAGIRLVMSVRMRLRP